MTEGVLEATGDGAPAVAASDRSEAVVGWLRISACLPDAGAAAGVVDVVCAATLAVAASVVLTAAARDIASEASDAIGVGAALVSGFAWIVPGGGGAAEDDLLAARAAAAIASGATAASDAVVAAGASATGTATGIAAASGTTIKGAADVACWGVTPSGSVAEVEVASSVDEALSAVFVVDFASLVFEDLAPDCGGASLLVRALLTGCDALDRSTFESRSSGLSLRA